MKLLSNTKSRWLQGCGALLMLCALWFTPQGAYANDYLEKEDHYKAYPTGVDRVHFVLPVWAYGKSYDFYIHESSTIWYKKKVVIPKLPLPISAPTRMTKTRKTLTKVQPTSNY